MYVLYSCVFAEGLVKTSSMESPKIPHIKINFIKIYLHLFISENNGKGHNSINHIKVSSDMQNAQEKRSYCS